MSLLARPCRIHSERTRLGGVHHTDPTSAETFDEKMHRQRWAILGLLCTSLLIVVIGNTTLNVILPTLSEQLGATESQLQWVVAIYSLVFAGLLFTTGALGDRFGRKGALQLGLVIFLAGSTYAAFGTSMTQLIVCRGVMGIGAALIMPSTLSILINVFPPHERPKAIAIWASVAGAGGGFGPLVSGALLAHFWWGSVFLVNVPLVVGALVVGMRLMPTSRDPHKAPLDPIGAVISTIGIVAIVYALIEAPEKGWLSAETLVATAIGVVFLALFVAWERRSGEPMLDMSYFRNRAFSTGVGGMILVFTAMFGVFFLMTQYFQQVLGYTPLAASVRLLPTGLIILAVAPNTPRLTARFGSDRVVAAGMFLLGGALLSFRTLRADSSYWSVFLSLIPMSVGMALTSSPMTSSIMSAVPPRRAGAGSSMNDATRELGAALGIAILGSLTASHYTSALEPALAGLDPASQSIARGSLAGAVREAAKLPAGAARALSDAASQAFVDGIRVAVTVGGAGAVVAGLVVLRFLPREVVHEGALHSPIEALEATADVMVGQAMAIVDADLPQDRTPDEADALIEGRSAPSVTPGVGE